MEGGNDIPEVKWEEKAGAEPPRLTRSEACDVRANLATNGASPEVPANERFHPVPTNSTSSSIGTSRSMSEDSASYRITLGSGTGTSESWDGGLGGGTEGMEMVGIAGGWEEASGGIRPTERGGTRDAVLDVEAEGGAGTRNSPPVHACLSMKQRWHLPESSIPTLEKQMALHSIQRSHYRNSEEEMDKQ